MHRQATSLFGCRCSCSLQSLQSRLPDSMALVTRAVPVAAASARPRSTTCKAAEAETVALEAPKYTNVGPQPKRFTVGDGQLGAIATSAIPALFRLGSGALCSGYSVGLAPDDGTYAVARVAGRRVAETSKVAGFPRPAQPLELYEFEGCPFCKKVREAVSILDLDVVMYPTPQGGDLWRPKVVAEGGKSQFPYLKDPNTGKAMYESDDIIKYLFDTYGDGQVPTLLKLGFFTTLTAGLGLAVRLGSGNRAAPSKQPAQPLVLYGYEASPFVKVVREALCEMQLPYLYKCVARGSPRRDQVLKEFGHFQVPLLVDPNNKTYCFESAAIVRYLKHEYGPDA